MDDMHFEIYRDYYENSRKVVALFEDLYLAVLFVEMMNKIEKRYQIQACDKVGRDAIWEWNRTH